ncbi:GNAT family N-acetyltransferase [Micromonospora andamanensis]|uniref:Acetyltransferase n=1 Tax=Micromonospora andamanensis TaxID=1287068 RepID=A0ABQ4I5R9_9ACTN|nr:GNAT family N-acetyltransferase [Micromonospora andamanensis]GIJ13250.1 acetyltransferase [Micromonospora andamanensis]GIJ38350.1 acetyltransferase [Micromonospora andamanensis]
MLTLRPYRSADCTDIRDICIRTAYAGEDARPHYAEPDLLPEIFAVPYVHFEPELAFIVADTDDRAVGYVLGTADTERFVRLFRDEWLPSIAGRYPPLGSERQPQTSDDVMRHLLHTPERMLVPDLADYPAHLHIDLLPPYQRAGYGRRLIAAFIEALAKAGVPAVHLGMVTENAAARAFYDRLGFHVINVPDPGPLTYLGMRIPANPRTVQAGS